MSQNYGFTKENKGKVDAALDFPKLRLKKKGEVARLAIFGISTDENGKRALSVPVPEGGYYFDLRIPGAEKDYVGSFECLASEDQKKADEYDPDACPHCAVVLAGNVSEEVMRKRVRRFVMPVVKYATAPNSSNLVTPPSVEVLAWKFTDRYFNQLIDAHEKWADSGGMLGHDITLTCDVPTYATYIVSVEPDAAYAADAELGKLVMGSYIAQTASLANGLGRVLGSKLNSVDLQKKISDTITQAAQLGTGAPATSVVPTIDPATIENLATDLLGDASVPEVAEVAAPAAEVAVPEMAAAPATEAVVADGGEVDFDDFFNNG